MWRRPNGGVEGGALVFRPALVANTDTHVTRLPCGTCHTDTHKHAAPTARGTCHVGLTWDQRVSRHVSASTREPWPSAAAYMGRNPCSYTSAAAGWSIHMHTGAHTRAVPAARVLWGRRTARPYTCTPAAHGCTTHGCRTLGAVAQVVDAAQQHHPAAGLRAGTRIP